MAKVEGDPWERFVDELADRLPAGARVLDLGCGNGAKIARLADRFDVAGVDISERQLQLARAAVPEATFHPSRLHGAATSPPRRSTRSPRSTRSFTSPGTSSRLCSLESSHWLKPGGLFLASLSHVGGEDRVDEWLGVDMFFSGFDANTNRRLVREAGFELIDDQLVWMQEPEMEVAFLWVLARKPG